MPHLESIMATTNVIQRGERKTAFTKEQLEALAEGANGEFGIPYTVQHDPSCLTIGKTTRAWVEPHETGYCLKAITFVDDSPDYFFHPKAETELVRLRFQEAPKPFLRKFEKVPDDQTFLMSIDLSNFNTQADFNKFREDLAGIDDSLSLRLEERHELDPATIIQFVISYPEYSAVGLWAFFRIEKFVRGCRQNRTRVVDCRELESVEGGKHDSSAPAPRYE